MVAPEFLMEGIVVVVGCLLSSLIIWVMLIETSGELNPLPLPPQVLGSTLNWAFVCEEGQHWEWGELWPVPVLISCKLCRTPEFFEASLFSCVKRLGLDGIISKIPYSDSRHWGKETRDWQAIQSPTQKKIPMVKIKEIKSCMKLQMVKMMESSCYSSTNICYHYI